MPMSSYTYISDHHSMVFDSVRNDCYSQAIKDEVTENSVVLDLGAGLGVHGFMAADAGAKKVYLVEPASIIEITKQLVDSNGLTDKIESIQGIIEKVELPEKVDCIVSVFTGNFLLSEDLLPSLFYARDKYLNSGGVLIPDRAKMEVVPIYAQEYYDEYIDCWSNSPDLDYQMVRHQAVNTLYYDYFNERNEQSLAEPVELLDLDFMQATEASCRSRISVNITDDGICHGWLGWFQARIGKEWLSTSPDSKKLHWRQVFLPLNEPLNVKKGETLEFELNRPEFGEWTWTTTFADKKQRQSTFYSSFKSPKELLATSDDYIPELSDLGKVARFVLKLIDGGHSTLNMIESILQKYPTLFKDHKSAEAFVKSLIRKYA